MSKLMKEIFLCGGIFETFRLMMEQKSQNVPLDIARSTRDVPPAHYILKIESFSQLVQHLSDTERKNYESNIFEASGYKWKLSLYPNGDKERNGEGYISLYLVIAETESLPIGWEVKVNFKMFVFDQEYGTYSVFQDNNGKLHNFHESKTEFGFAKLLPLKIFKDPSNGFLIRDKCVFGVEVFVFNYSGRVECLSLNQKVEATHTWRIDNFSSFNKYFHRSEEFTLGNRTWAIEIYPKGVLNSNREWLSLYLMLKDTEMKGNAYVNCKLRIRNRLHGYHQEQTVKRLFEQFGWGSPVFLALRDLHNASKGFLIEDTLIIEIKIIAISSVKKSVLPS